MQWVPNEKKEQPEQEPDDLTIAYMAGFYDGKNTPQRKPEQEPVAWMDEYGDVLSASVVDGSGLRNIPLYTTPPQPKPEQEPVTNGIIRTLVSIDKDGIEMWKHEPFYTAPPKREWVGLTGPEVVEAYRSVSEKEWAIGGLDDARVFFCAIEAKLREKNGG